MVRAAELAELDDEELMGRLAEYRRELLNLRFQNATSQLDDPSRVASARRDVARVLTLLREREIALAEGHEAPSLVAARRRPVRVPEEETFEEPAVLEAPAELVDADDLEDEELEEDEEFADDELAVTDEESGSAAALEAGADDEDEYESEEDE